MTIFNKNFKISFSKILFIIIFGISLEEEININKNNFQFYLQLGGCPDGTRPCGELGGICVPEADCPSPLYCPDDYLNINLYSCGLEPKFAPQSQCRLNYECWDNTCVTDPSEKLSQCPTLVSCPDLRKKCFDNSCVINLEDCPNYYECPSFLPIRCPNGDCRQSLEDCPSIVTCPKKLPILCNDGSCHLLKKDCEYSSEETQCSDISMVRCPDGSCTSSKSLCSTPMTCPIGYQKCYNGLCKKIGECYNMTIQSSSSICNDENQVLCNFDFSCRNEISSCPTGIICPADRPVKCWDNSCKENIKQCPEYQTCPELMNECADGSCSTSNCGTHITCSIEAPFRCFDNTCKKNPEDCPQMPSCPSDKPILCWDGRCLADRGECLSPSECENLSPVKCPDGLCYQSGDSCKSIEDCPAEFIKCPDGTCKKSIKDCNSKECPLNFPNRCKNGMCVSKIEYCEKDNGCPWNKPYKCPNGKCVEKDNECINNNLPCPNGKRRCPDGSCLPLSTKCPAESGCSVDTPIKCADGSCIKNNEKETCPIPICPSSQPYRCVNGLCVTTISACPSEYKHSEENPKLVICADSTLAHFFDECKPVFDCTGTNTIRCGDGSCRTDLLFCPMQNSTHYLDTCPKGTSRCENGECSNEEGQCLLSNGCYQSSENQYKCISNGACVRDEDECEELSLKYNLANGCPNEYPIKCPITQKCVITELDCDNYDIGCEQEGKYMCSSGRCVDSFWDCFENETYCFYEGKSFTCNPDSEAKCADEFRHCYNKENCQIDSPFRCISGNCKKYPYSLLALENENNDKNEYCELGIQCPEYKPYLCLDGSCVEKTSFCKSLESCPEGKQYRCFDRTCASSQRICETQHNKCPGSNPILCPNGNCASNIVDCLDTTCPPWYPYKCITGTCEKVPGECLLQEIRYESNENDDEDYGEEEEEGIKIYGNICKEDEFLCFDGTCRKDKNDCPLYEGCTTLSKPYKCSDGSCVSSKDECILNSTFLNCTNNTVLCQDGLCRKECPEFNGCPNEKPLLCSNGHCVTSLAECAGYSSCFSSNSPFRCADGSCAAKLSDCKSILREFGTTNIVLMTYPHLETNVPIVIGELNLQMASLNVPSDTFLSENESVESRIFINSVPKSKFNKTYSKYDKTRYDDVLLVYPYSDPTGTFKLDYEYAILSTVLNITAEKKTLFENKKDIIWNNNLILTILYDFPYKHEGIVDSTLINKKRYSRMPLDSLTDICLGKLEEETGLWKCVGLSQEAKSYNNFQLKASFNSSGIYAVILDPKQNTNKLNIEYSFFLRYLLPITLVILLILLILGVLCYIFSRIYRYRRKYKASKDAYNSTNIEFNKVGMRQSKIQGETLADQEEGVIWTQNPCYRNAINEDSVNNRQLEDMRDKFTKKLKALEKNNSILQEQTQNMKDEIKRLKDYKAKISVNN